MPCPSHPLLLDHSNYIWRRVQLMKLLITQFSPNFHHFIYLRSKYYNVVSVYPWLYSPCEPWPLFQFLNLYTVGWTLGRGINPTYRTTQTQNKSTQASMPWVRFEHTIPVFERAKTVHALYRGATVIGNTVVYKEKILKLQILCLTLEIY
jgi:hypothetical protein